MRTVRVALAGCGVVGSEVVRLLQQNEHNLAARYATRFELVRVLVRGTARARPAELPPELLTTDVDAFLSTRADVVVEAIGGLDPAARIARTVLASGRRLVTANKVLIAAHGPELVQLAARNRTRIDFESAVAGGIPILRAIRDQLAVTDIQSIRGILNGTSNYILTRLEEGMTYAEACQEAQEKGFAEADPSRDVSGGDAADKIRILAWLAFGVAPTGITVRTRGIVPHPDRLAADAAAIGGVPRLVAECVRVDTGVAAAVEPVIVRPDSPLGQVRGENNVVVVQSRWNGTLHLAGPGARGGPTACALVGDLIRSARPLRYPRSAELERTSEETRHRWLISVDERPGAERSLVSALEHASLEIQQLVSDGRTPRVFIDNVPWSSVEQVAQALHEQGLTPVVSRVEV